MRVAIEIPENEIPTKQDIISVAIHFMDSKIVECDYPFIELEQEPKTGHWYIDERPESNREIICSNCEQPVFKYHKLDFDYRPRYCPNCGAKMSESEE